MTVAMKRAGKIQKEKLEKLYDLLYAIYGELQCPLLHETPFQLLVAVILSAQCRDDRVNIVTRELFKKYGDVYSMAKADVSTIEKIIKPAGLYHAKAQNITGMARMLIADHDGKVPDSMDELVKLPGVGRKTANVILGDAFHLPGFPVDTHVKRILNRLELVHSDVPEKIEAEVDALIEPEKWSNFSHLIIQHGRNTCKAIKPKCEECSVREGLPCPYFIHIQKAERSAK